MLKSNRPLAIIIVTAFLDLLGFGIILPSLPFIIRDFGLSETWVGITFALFSLGTFIGGIVFGRLSDVYGRKNMLIVTSTLNFLGYALFLFSSNIWIFILARIIGGLGGAGMSIAQAYISDVSKSEDRTKNLGKMGAVFGIAFMIGPVLGGLLSGGSLHTLGAVSATVVFLNILLIVFALPDIHRKATPKAEEESVIPVDFHHHKKQILFLFTITFITALGFASMQSTFSLLVADRFAFDEKMIGYLFGYIGICSVLYQGFLIKYVRRIFDERGMILFGLAVLAGSFVLFAFNPYMLLIFPILLFFPIGYGTINPATGALLAHYATRESGKALGTNMSMMSLGQVVGPFIAGMLYTQWSGYPYLFASALFMIAFALVSVKIRRKG